MWRDAKGKESRAIESGKATVAMARGVRDDVRGGGEGDGDGSKGAWYDEDEGERGARGVRSRAISSASYAGVRGIALA